MHTRVTDKGRNHVRLVSVCRGGARVDFEQIPADPWLRINLISTDVLSK